MKKLIIFFLSFALVHLSAENQESFKAPAQLNGDNIQEIWSSTDPIVIDVYADWCGPCRRFAPVFKEASEKYGDQYRFYKLNGDEERDLVQLFRVRAYPTILYLKNGNEVGRHEGSMNKADFTAELKKHLSQ